MMNFKGKCKYQIAWMIGIAVLLIPFVIALYAFVVMVLWNWLIPDIFGFQTITIWQSLGLIVLFKLLFHKFHWKKNGGCKGSNCCSSSVKEGMKAKFKDKFEGFSENEKMLIMEKFKSKCSPEQPKD